MIKEELADFISALGASEEVIRYKRACEELRAFPELEKRVHEFRQKNYLLQNTKENKDLFVEIDRLEKEYSDLYSGPVTAEFLAAELAICRIVQQVNLEMINCIEFESVLVDDESNGEDQ